MFIIFIIFILYIQGGAFKVLQAIISESMRRTKNIFRQKFCEFEGDIRYYWFDLEWRCQDQSKATFNFFNETSHFSLHILVAYLKSFSKHYNNIFKYFSNYKLQYCRL